MSRTLFSNVKLVTASTDYGLVYSEWYFKYITPVKGKIIKHIELNSTPPTCSYVTLCILFPVHKKLSVAHTEDFNHTIYIEIMSLYHPSLSKANNIIK